nr:predicted protein [Mycena chlorophos]
MSSVLDSPPSMDTPSRHSIDLSIQLEYELDSESLPPTPAPPEAFPEPEPAPSVPFQLPDIDPMVLAHIITQLRQQITELTKEKTELIALLTAAHTKEADLEDVIALLRTKVEESRRGLMRLQAENRRSQPGTLDISRANAPSAFSLGPASSKRASATFTPLTGTFAAQTFVASRPNSQRRMSMSSESNVDALAVVPAAPSHNRRLSAIFGRSSPPQLTLDPSASPDELDKLRKQVKTLQDALDETRHDLTEANEAREASETCAAALRDYIAENSMDVKLPPLPAATTGDEESEPVSKKAAAWPFWKVDTNVGRANGPSSAATATPVAPAATLSRKLTGFFSSRASISSNHGQHGRANSVYSASDVSSMVEPISPTNEVGSDVRVAGGSPELAGGVHPDSEYRK